MMRLGGVLMSVMLAVLLLPMSGLAGESGGPTKQPRTDLKPGTKSLSQGETVRKADEKDVQTRGLLSKKKKKKKPVAGAAGHMESSDQEDLPAHGRSGEGR